MKKEEKIQYFTRLVEKMGEKVIPTKDLYRIIEETDKELGKSVKECRQRFSIITNKLIQVLGDKLEVVEGEGEKRGRYSPKWFSLKTNGEEGINNIKSDIISYFKREEVFATKRLEKARESKKGRKTKITFLKRLWNILVKVKKERLEIVSFQKLKEVGGLATVNAEVLKNWKESLKKAGINLDFRIIKDDRHSKVQFINLSNTIIQMAEAMKKAFPKEEIDVKSVLGLGKKLHTSINSSMEDEKQNSNNADKAYMIYAIGGILKTQAAHRVELDVMASCLRKGFNISTTKAEIIEISRSNRELFEINNYNQSIRLVNENLWPEIKKQFGPQNFKRQFLVRLGMSLEEVKERVPEMEVELVSKINEYDGIYKIVYNRTVHHKKELVKLFRSFRQNDKILDDEALVDLLEREIEVIDGRSYKDDLAYNIENI